jgi:hypothetical protein
MPCTIHKSSGAREALDCAIEGSTVWKIQGVFRLAVNDLSALSDEVAGSTERPQLRDGSSSWNQGHICGFHSRRVSGQYSF